MSLLNRLNGDHSDDEPHLVPGRSGRPSFSLDALRERIEAQFKDETANRADILLELDTEDKQRALVNEVAEYVLAQEVITLSPDDKAALIDRVYRSLFTFGPLDAYLDDDAITEITVKGPHTIHVRRGLEPFEPVPETFEDAAHLATLLEHVAAAGGAALSDSDPFLEIGVVLRGRFARISLISPPISPEYSLQIRLHPRQPVTLDDLHARFHAVPPQAAALLQAILAGGHGLLIVGDVGQGKTTLASALIASLPEDASILAVERAAELHLPPQVARRTVIAPTPDHPGADFEAQIQAALDESPAWLIVDEIRGDESAAIWSALSREDAPRYLWVFRGASQPDRLRSALGMVIRKKNQAVDQDEIHRALAQHLPFIAAFRLVEGAPRLTLIAEMVLDKAAHTLTFRTLLSEESGGWLVTENRPVRPLALPDDFWS